MFVIAIHGGAGLSTPSDLGIEREIEARKALQQSLEAGHNVLARGGSATDAVVAAVKVLEDSPMFNAGHGSVLASDGACYMDASLMDGAEMKAGALCGSTQIKNPIVAAKAIMDTTPYVMLFGEDLARFAREQGLEMKDPSYFLTAYRQEQLVEAKRENTIILDHEKATKAMNKAKEQRADNNKGTVGAVALDSFGNLAAATSTGGLCNKAPGRIGDSAVIGAGTYAKNSTCAVSATGQGELFIRANVAGRLSAMIEFSPQPNTSQTMIDAAHRIVWQELPEDVGGVIAVDRNGTVTLPFNTGGMFRGHMADDAVPHVAVWTEEVEKQQLQLIVQHTK